MKVNFSAEQEAQLSQIASYVGIDAEQLVKDTALRLLAGTGADLVAAMQASPFKEIDIQPSRAPLPVRDVGSEG